MTFEQFVRQASLLSSKPIVVFSTSNTPNWEAELCDKIDNRKNTFVMSESDKKLLELFNINPQALVSANRNDMDKYDVLEASYQIAGIQYWHHGHYKKYACHGPYIREWGFSELKRDWHPSTLGQELRGAHFAYFWLLILKDALSELNLDNNDMITSKLNKIRNHVDFIYETSLIPSKPIVSSNFTDRIQCLTTYIPRGDPSSHLVDYIVPNKDINTLETFQLEILEKIYRKKIYEEAVERGMKDYKYVLRGNNSSSPISFKLNVKQNGKVFICQPPELGGQNENGKFWKTDAKFYLNLNVPNNLLTSKMILSENNVSGTYFKFDAKQSIQLNYIVLNPTVHQPMCVMFSDDIMIGTHVLTVVPPTTDQFIHIAYLLIP